MRCFDFARFGWDSEFNEADHPRDKAGEFAEKGSGSEPPDKPQGPASVANRDEASSWTVGEHRDDPVGYRDTFIGDKHPFNNHPQTWKTIREAENAFYGRHRVGITYNKDTGLSEKLAVEKAKVIDHVLVDLADRFPGLASTHDIGYSNKLRLHEQSLLGGIELVKGRRVGGFESTTLGQYGGSGSFKDITIASSLSTKEGVLRKGGWTVTGENLPGVFRHEYGHAIEHNFATLVRRNNGFGIVQEGPAHHVVSHLWNQQDKAKVIHQLSKYAATSKAEWFAESFAAYTHPQYEQRGPRIDPTLERLFDAVFKGKAPDAQRA